MLKEIHEGPEAIRNAMRGRLNRPEGTAKLGGLEAVAERLQAVRHLVIISCGTSYLAGLLGRYLLENLTRWSVEVELASEFRYRKMNLRPGTAVLAISQSGETADTLAALREAKHKDVLVLGIPLILLYLMIGWPLSILVVYLFSLLLGAEGTENHEPPATPPQDQA